MNKTFVQRYAENMKANHESGKNVYVVPLSWEALAEKMSVGILAGRALVSDTAKLTAKQLGFPKSVAGVKAAISSPQ